MQLGTSEFLSILPLPVMYESELPDELVHDFAVQPEAMLVLVVKLRSLVSIVSCRILGTKLSVQNFHDIFLHAKPSSLTESSQTSLSRVIGPLFLKKHPSVILRFRNSH